MKRCGRICDGMCALFLLYLWDVSVASTTRNVMTKLTFFECVFIAFFSFSFSTCFRISFSRERAQLKQTSRQVGCRNWQIITCLLNLPYLTQLRLPCGGRCKCQQGVHFVGAMIGGRLLLGGVAARLGCYFALIVCGCGCVWVCVFSSSSNVCVCVFINDYLLHYQLKNYLICLSSSFISTLQKITI